MNISRFGGASLETSPADKPVALAAGLEPATSEIEVPWPIQLAYASIGFLIGARGLESNRRPEPYKGTALPLSYSGALNALDGALIKASLSFVCGVA